MNRRPTAVESKTKVGNFVEQSLCTKSVQECLFYLRSKSKDARRRGNTKSADCSEQMLSLLEELQVRKILPLDEASDYYYAGLKDVSDIIYSERKKYRQNFKIKLLDPNGLPVIIVTASRQSFVLLLEDSSNDEGQYAKGIDMMLGKLLESRDLSEKLLSQLSPYFSNAMQLLSTNKDRSIVIFILTQIFSSTSLTNHLGISGILQRTSASQIKPFVELVDSKLSSLKEEVDLSINNQIKDLKVKIDQQQDILNKKRDRLPDDLIEDREFEISVKQQRLERLQSNTSQMKKQIVYRTFNQWKRKIKSQIGKKKGKYLINHAAEKAIYDCLAENAKAHRRRHGEEGTSYINEDSQRIQSREMRMIANKALKQLNQRLIKSKETVRSFGKPRNKQSYQAKQHRGQWLWSYTRSEKKDADPKRHINVHHNRAFAKNFTRLLFGRNSPLKDKHLSLRITFDDKAYLRCNTGEEFCRPIHKPIQLNDKNLRFELPMSDYPEKCGYVTPGVILMVNDQEEVEFRGRDKFVPKDVTVSVTAKPKMVYPSNPTNWENDRYTIRLEFRKEHEVPYIISDPPSDELLIPLIFMRDSLLQFELMNIPEDFLRINEKGDHLLRERLRISTLSTRVSHVCRKLEDLKAENEKLVNIFKELMTLETKLANCHQIIVSDISLGNTFITSLYQDLEDESKMIRLMLEAIPLPKHRPVEIQSSDRSPGVGSNERLVQIRMAETFQIYNLDLQARVHYAPNDSPSHIAEKVMRSLNEHAGDGRTINIPKVELTELEDIGVLLNMSKTELEILKEKQQELASKRCAELVARKYQGNPQWAPQFMQERQI